MSLDEPVSVVVVDDDEDTQEVLGWALTARGIRVTRAANGREALQRIATTSVDAILLDLEMPVLDGRAFLLSRPPGLVTPVIVLSAASDRANLHGTAHVVAVMDKPCDVAKLMTLIEAVARSRT